MKRNQTGKVKLQETKVKPKKVDEIEDQNEHINEVDEVVVQNEDNVSDDEDTKVDTEPHVVHQLHLNQIKIKALFLLECKRRI